jgi:2-methylcitrate dehydratase PrpD
MPAMATVESRDHDSQSLTPTKDLGAMVAALKADDIPESARRWAKHCILDWIAVTVGGAGEPLTEKLLEVALAEGATGRARVIGHADRVIGSQAALINGAASHALDYDDVNERMLGHPTVPLVPALMALADESKISGMDMITAFVAGYEVEARLSDMTGVPHIDNGWHSTATIGTFGAAAASANLMGLDAEQSTAALGIAATQAAGLRAMFGTMCKPLHAGKASSNGLLAARLAAKGFTSRDDAIEGENGFAATQAEGFVPLPVYPKANGRFAVEENLFKYHAACYLTHAGIDALRKVRDEAEIKPEEVVAVREHVPATHFTVCNIPEPETGLEIKFSMRHTAAMVLSGIDTGAMSSYTDEAANRNDLVDLRRKVEIVAKPFDSRMQAEVVVELADGRSVVGKADVGVPASDVDLQERRLSEKFLALVGPVVGEARAEQALKACLNLDQMDDAARIFDAVAG